MKIIVDPKWTFMEALEAAWDAYRGGLQFGVPNRIRVLEQWANVVGRQKAVSELEATLAVYKDAEEIKRYLGLSSYTVKKLRKQFKAMPVVTPFVYTSGNPSTFSKRAKNIDGEVNDIDVALSQFLKLAHESGVDPLSKVLTSLAQERGRSTIDEYALRQLLDISQNTGIDVVGRLIDWMTNIAKIEDVVNILEKLNANDLQKLNAAVGLSSLKSVLEIWRTNKENESEEFWQGILAQNSFLFAQLFSFPVIVLEDKAYIGGKGISNQGGNIIDFLCANNLTRNVVLVEIKTPKTRLLGSKYRGDIYNISSELSGSIIQVTNYKNSLIKNHANLVSSEENK